LLTVRGGVEKGKGENFKVARNLIIKKIKDKIKQPDGRISNQKKTKSRQKSDAKEGWETENKREGAVTPSWEGLS